jgi:hypothetical protein
MTACGKALAASQRSLPHQGVATVLDASARRCKLHSGLGGRGSGHDGTILDLGRHAITEQQQSNPRTSQSAC